MKPALLAVCGSCLFAAGWLAAKHRMPEAPPPAAPPESAKRQRPVRGAAEMRTTRLRELADDAGRLSAEIKDLPVAEIPALIEILASDAGIEGLDDAKRNQIRQLLRRRYEEAPEDTYAWIVATEHAGNRRFYLEVVLDAAAGKDPEQAMELAEQSRRDTGAPPPLPEQCVNHAAKQGAGSLLSALELATGSRTRATIYGYNVKFPPDFDFAGMASGLADLQSRLAEGEQSFIYAHNFSEEWARRDPQAAYEWALAIQVDPSLAPGGYNNGLSGFFRGYAKLAEPAEYGRFVAEALGNSEATEEFRRLEAFEALSSYLDSAAIDAFIATSAARSSEEQVLKELLTASHFFRGGDSDTLLQRVWQRVPEGRRAEFLKIVPEDFRRKLGGE